MRDIRTLGAVIYDSVKAYLVTAWEANRDAGGFRLRNLGAPVEYDDAVRKVDILDAQEAAAGAVTAASEAQTVAASALEAAETATTAAAAAQSAADDATDDAAAAMAVATAAVPTTRALTAGNGLVGGGTLAADRTFALDFGTDENQVRHANDAAYTDARTPTSHAETHEDGGDDEIDVTGLAGVLAQPQRAGSLAASGGDLAIGAITDGHVLVRSGSSVTSTALPVGDITAVAAGTGLSGGGTSGTVTLAVTYGSTAGTAAEGNDARLSDARTPTGHSASHENGGGDELALDASQITTGTLGIARVTSASDGQIIQRSGSALVGVAPNAILAGASAAISTNNQRIVNVADPTGDQDVATKAYVDSLATDADITAVTAGSGLTGGGSSGSVSLAADFGTGAGKVTEGNDSRLANDRTASGIRTATTVVSVATAAAPNAGQILVATSSTAAAWQDAPESGGGGDIEGVTAGTGLSGGGTSGTVTLNVVYGSTANTACEGDDNRLSDARTPTAHAASHATGQSDAIAPADIGAVPTSRTVSAGTGLSGGGDLSANRSLAVSFGSSSGTACEGNDSRLTNARTPTAHASSHEAGGSDEIDVTSLSGILADPQVADTIAATGGNLTVGTIGDGEMLVRSGSTIVSAAVPTGDITAVVAGTGLSGGATSGSATLNVVYGTDADTAAEGNDSRIVNAVPNTRTVSAGTGLTGGGDLTANRSFAVSYGSSAGTAAEGNDARLSDDRTASGLRSATTVVSVSSATAPTSGQVLTATSGTAATWQTPSGGGSFTSEVNTWGATPTSDNLRAAMTDETGTGSLVFATSPTLVTPNLGTPSALTLTNATGLPASGVTSGTFALARMTTGSAGQPLRVNVAGTGIEGAFPPMAFTTTNAVTTTPTVLMTLTLPWAGEYLLESKIFPTQTVSGTRITTVQFDITNVTTVELTVFRGTGAAFTTQEITASGQSVSQSLNQNQKGLIDTNGRLVVSAPATFTFTVSQDTGSATLSGGSFARATRIS